MIHVETCSAHFYQNDWSYAYAYHMLNICLAITSNIVFSQGILENPKDIVSYLNKKGVSVIFLFRRNTLRMLISVLANDYDKDAKQLNRTHKSHVHSKEEVSSMHKQFQTEFTDIALSC